MKAVAGEVVAIPILVGVEIGGLTLQDSRDVKVQRTKSTQDVDVTIVAVDGTVITPNGLGVSVPPLSGCAVRNGKRAGAVDNSDTSAGYDTIPTRTVIARKVYNTRIVTCRNDCLENVSAMRCLCWYRANSPFVRPMPQS